MPKRRRRVHAEKGQRVDWGHMGGSRDEMLLVRGGGGDVADWEL